MHLAWTRDVEASAEGSNRRCDRLDVLYYTVLYYAPMAASAFVAKVATACRIRIAEPVLSDSATLNSKGAGQG